MALRFRIGALEPVQGSELGSHGSGSRPGSWLFEAGQDEEKEKKEKEASERRAKEAQKEAEERAKEAEKGKLEW